MGRIISNTLAAVTVLVLSRAACAQEFDANDTAASATVLERVEILGKTPPMYVAPSATTATKTYTPIRDVPQSIEVRSAQLIKDLGSRRVDDVAKTVAGVQVNWLGNGGSQIPFLTMRGFSNNGVVLQDGYRRNGGFYSILDDANIERVEFLKGPSSVLYGATGSLGGAANYVSKRPSEERIAESEVGLGAFGFMSAKLDLGGRVAHDAPINFRLNASAARADSYRDVALQRSTSIAPAFDIQFDEGRRLTVLADFVQSRQRPDFGLPVTPVYREIPIHRYAQEPAFDSGRAQTGSVTIEYEQTLTPDWKFVVGISSARSDWFMGYTYPSVPDPDGAPFLATRLPSTEHVVTFDRDLELRLVGRMQALGATHDWLFGLGRTLSSSIGDKFIEYAYFSPLDLRAPVYGGTLSGAGPEGSFLNKAQTTAPYLQDLMALSPSVKLLVGARLDSVTQSSDLNQWFDVTSSDRQTERKVSPRLGLVFQPRSDLTLYAGYTTSFLPSIGRSRTGTPFRPEDGRQFELGIKQQFGRDLDVNLALYELRRGHVLTPDPADPQNFSVQTGEQRSRGLEIDINGRLTRRLRVTAALALMQARVTQDDTVAVGTELIGAPRVSSNLFGVWACDGRLAGLEVGGGVHFVGSTQAQMPNTFRVGSLVQWDAMASYRLTPTFKLQANLKNVADRRNDVVSDVGYITPLTPRALSITLNASF